MKPRDEPPNDFEIEGRRVKVGKLVAAIEEHFDAELPEYGIAEALERTWTPKDWKRVADAHKIKKPSITTIVAVIAEFRKRERAGRAA